MKEYNYSDGKFVEVDAKSTNNDASQDDEKDLKIKDLYSKIEEYEEKIDVLNYELEDSHENIKALSLKYEQTLEEAKFKEFAHQKELLNVYKRYASSLEMVIELTRRI